jgi:nitrate/nitrite transporter NarK
MLGTLLGVQSAIAGIAGAAAPIATGLLYDRFRDYHAAIYASAAVTFVAFLLVLTLQGKRRLTQKATEIGAFVHAA